MKKTQKLLLAALFTCIVTNSFAEDSFQWHGYFRAGMGVDKDLGFCCKKYLKSV